MGRERRCAQRLRDFLYKFVPVFQFNRIDEILDVLFVGLGDDEQETVAFCYDVVFESLDDNEFGVAVDDGAGSVGDNRLVADYDIAVGILVGVFVQRTPCAEVAPREQRGYHIHVVMQLHDADVDADVGTFGIYGVDVFLLLVGVIDILALRKEPVDFGLMLLESLRDGVDVPNKNA